MKKAEGQARQLHEQLQEQRGQRQVGGVEHDDAGAMECGAVELHSTADSIARAVDCVRAVPIDDSADELNSVSSSSSWVEENNCKFDIKCKHLNQF